MPRKASWPPRIYVHKSGRAFIRVRKDGRSRDYYLEGTPGSDECRAHYARLVAELSTGGVPRPEVPRGGEVTVFQLIDRWRAERGPEHARKELEQYGYSLAPLVDLYGTTPARDFRIPQLKTVRAEMVRRGWCRNVVNRRIVRVRTVFRWAEEADLIPPGSWHHLCTLRSLPKNAPHVRQTAPTHVTSREELQAVLAHLREPLRTMLEVQWLSGMRSCEVRLMAASRIDRTQPTWIYSPEKDKSGWREGQAPRAVFLGPECQRLLTPFLLRAEEYLFPTRRAPHYSDTSYAHEIDKACKKAGVKVTGYGGRHAAKLRVTREHGLDAARAFLGQKSLGTTNQYAAEIDHKTAEEVARKLA